MGLRSPRRRGSAARRSRSIPWRRSPGGRGTRPHRRRCSPTGCLGRGSRWCRPTDYPPPQRSGAALNQAAIVGRRDGARGAGPEVERRRNGPGDRPGPGRAPSLVRWRVKHEVPDRRVPHDPVVDALEPIVEPAEALDPEVEALTLPVEPGPDDQLLGHGEVGEPKQLVAGKASIHPAIEYTATPDRLMPSR